MSGFDSLLSLWGKNRTNKLLLSDLLSQAVKEGRRKEADEALEQLDTPDSIAPELLPIIVEFKINTGQFEQASPYIQALKVEPNYTNAFVYFSLIQQFLLNRFDDVIQFYLAHQKVADAIPEARLVVARAYYGLLDMNNALSVLADDQHSEALELKSLLYYDLGQFDKVRECAEPALRSLPRSYLARIALASLYIRERQYIKASELVEYCVEQYASQGRGWALKGQLAFERLDFNEAIAALKQATTLMPEHIGSWHLLAWTHYLMGDKQEAFTAFKTAFDIDPAFADSQAAMAIIDLESGETVRAEGHIQKALRLDKDSATAQYANALLMQAKGQSQSAEKVIQSLLSSSDHDGVPFQHLIVEKLNKLRESQQAD